MGDPRVKIFIKLIFDILFLSAVLSTYFLEIFEYEKDFYITSMKIYKESTYKINGTEATPLTEVVIADFDEFHDHFCGSPTGDIKKVCDKKDDFKTAGILFIVFASMSQAFAVYAVMGLLGMACGCSCCGLLKYSFVNYVIPFIYLIGMGCYVFVSGMVSIGNVRIAPGIIVGSVAQLLTTIGTVYFFCNRKEMLALVMITHEDYEPMKKAEGK